MGATAEKIETPAPAKTTKATKRKSKAKEPSSGPSPAAPRTLRSVDGMGLQCEVDIEAFRRAMKALSTVVDAKSTMPMLHRVLLRTHDAGLTLVGTDLMMTMEIALPTTTKGALGDTTIECKRLLELARLLPEGAATITGARDKTWITSGDVDATVASMPARDFPTVPSFEGLTWHAIDASVVSDMIDEVLFAVCHDETRLHLNGAVLETTDDTIRMVATDGHRLSKSQRVTPTTFTCDITNAIIPEKALREIRRFLDDGPCELATRPDKRLLFVRQGAITFVTRAIDAQFPPYEQVIPTDNRKQVTVDRMALVRACKRAKGLCSDTRGVRLSLVGGKLTLTSDNPDFGELREALVADYLFAHEGYAMGVNPTFMIDVCERMEGDRLVLAMSCELDPILIRSIEDATQRPLDRAEFLHVVMPMRI